MMKVLFSMINLKNSFHIFVLIVVAQKCNCTSKFKPIQGFTNEVLKDDKVDYSFRENNNPQYNKSGNKSKYLDNDVKKIIININKSNQQDDGDDDEYKYKYVDDQNGEDNDSYKIKNTEDSALGVSEYKHDLPKKSKSSSVLQVVRKPKIFTGFSYINDDNCKKNKSDLYNQIIEKKQPDRDHDEKDKILSLGMNNDASDFFVHDKNSHINKVSKLASKSQHDSNSKLIAISDQQSRSKENFLIPHDDSMTYNQADSVELNYQTVKTGKRSKIWHDHKLKDKFPSLNRVTVRMENRMLNHFPKSPLQEQRYFNADNFYRNSKNFEMKKPFERTHSYSNDYMKNDYPVNDNYEISNKNLSPTLICTSNLKKNYRNMAKFKLVSELNKRNKFPKIVNSQNKNLFACNNLNDYSRKLRNAFTTSEEGGNDASNHMYLMQKKNEVPLFVKNYFRSMEESLKNNEADRSDNSNGSVRFENNSKSKTAFESNHFVDQINYPDLNIYRKNQFRNEKKLLADFNADRNEILVKEPVQNFSDYKVMSLNKARGRDSNIHNSFELEDNQVADSKKRSILTRQDAVFQPFHHISDYSEVMANLSNGNVKSSNIIYDYDMNEKGENTAENDFDINVSQNSFRGKGTSKISSEVINGLQKSEEEVKLFNQKSAGKAAHIPLAIDDGNLGKQVVVSNIKKYKAKQKKIYPTPDDGSHLTETSPKFTLSKKSESEELVHLLGKTVGRQCHPVAGPPKFRWCSEDSDPVKDQEYEDALKGKVALRIVEVILAKVQKSSKMLSDFGFCKNKKKPSANVEENECSAQSSILNSEDLKEIMLSIDNMSYKGCNQLPPKLRNFLEWLVKVKDVRSVHSKGVDSKKYSHSNCSPGDSAFLFHKYNAESFNGFAQPEGSKNSIHKNIPYKISSNDNNVYYSSNDKNSVDGINGASMNFVASDENLAKEKRNLMPKRKKPDFLQKYKRRVNNDNVNYYKDDINSDIKYSGDFVNDYEPNRIIRDEFKMVDELRSYPRSNNLKFPKTYDTEINRLNSSNMTNSKLFVSRKTNQKGDVQDLFEEYNINNNNELNLIENLKSNPLKIIGNPIEKQNKESDEISSLQELFDKDSPI